MHPDIEEYRPYLKHLDMSDDKKDELIRTVWLIMENAVDRAWNADSVQIALEARDNSCSKDAMDSGPVIELNSDEYQDLGLSNTFNQKKGE